MDVRRIARRRCDSQHFLPAPLRMRREDCRVSVACASPAPPRPAPRGHHGLNDKVQIMTCHFPGCCRAAR